MRNKVYLTSAFSLSMVTPPVNLRVEELNLKEFSKFLRENRERIVSRIGHESTTQVLRETFDEDVRKLFKTDRTPIKVVPGDTVIVFQILKRPAEGQVYTEEEIRDILARGLFKILKVEVS